MAEKILGLIEHTEGKVKGWRMKKWALIFTEDRLVVSKISGTMGVVLSSLGGIAGSVARRDIRGKISEKSEEAQAMSVEEILEADEENFAIPYEEIQRVEMKKGGLLSATSFTFKTEEGDYSFNLIDRKKFKPYSQMIKEILPQEINIA
ncbi:MAG: hypothetical protein ACOC6H_02160 [Thermoproteota archaeon]